MAKRVTRPKKKLRSEVQFALNGQWISVSGEDASAMLGDFLRKRRSLTGTKIVCAEGDCGACTVLKAAPFETLQRKSSSKSSGPRYLPVNSCIVPVATLDGSSIVTVDGLATNQASSPQEGPPHQRPGLHPAQEAMVRCHGSQCGFCTPGFVMALTGLVEKRLDRQDTDTPITEKEARNALTANLCRCTGYLPIIQAACSIPLSQCQSVRKRHETQTIRRELVKATKTPLLLETDEFKIFAPTTLKQAGEFLRKNPKATLVSGATDLGVIHNKRKKRLGELLSLHLIPELYRFQKKGKNRLIIGSRVTLSDLRDHLKEDLIPEFARFLDLFASPQIKNQATLAGNLANASPIGDTPPFLLVAGTIVHVFSSKEKPAKAIRQIPIEKFFLGYRKTALKPGEFITAIEIEQPSQAETLVLKKVSQRKDLDISTVNAAFRVRLDSKQERILESRIAYGGVAATPVRLKKTEKLLESLKLSDLMKNESFLALAQSLHDEITPIDDLRSSSSFRRVAAENLLRSFLQGMAAG